MEFKYLIVLFNLNIYFLVQYFNTEIKKPGESPLRSDSFILP